MVTKSEVVAYAIINNVSNLSILHAKDADIKAAADRLIALANCIIDERAIVEKLNEQVI